MTCPHTESEPVEVRDHRTGGKMLAHPCEVHR